MAERHCSKQKFKWSSLKGKSGTGEKNSRIQQFLLWTASSEYGAKGRGVVPSWRGNTRQKKSERHTGGWCMDLDFKFLLQVSNNLNQPSPAAAVARPLLPCGAPSPPSLVGSLCTVSSYLEMKALGGESKSPSQAGSAHQAWTRQQLKTETSNCSIGGWQKQSPHYW